MTSVASSAAIPSSPRFREKVLVLVPLLLSFAYAVTVLIQEWTPPARMRMLSNSLPVLQALLFQRGTRLDLYDLSFANGIVRTATEAYENSGELDFPPRLLSTNAALLSDARRARVRAMTSAYTYDPLEGRESSLTLLSRNTNFTFAISDDQSPPHLRMDFAGCGMIADLPLPERPDWYKPKQLFGTLGLPTQHRMLLSPAETSLAIVDHALLPHIILTDLLQRSARTLTVPSFDLEQLQFSPLFVDEGTLLFSVLDRNHWGTVLYRIAEGTYEILSPTFTDHGYHSLTGDVVLVQSFYDEHTNVPFGSIPLLEQSRGIPAEEIEALTGPRKGDSETLRIFSLLFQKPDDPILHFRSGLSASSFNAIPRSGVREALRWAWNKYYVNLNNAVGTFHVSTLKTPGTLAEAAVIPFELLPPEQFVRSVRDLEPLLNVLGLPPALIEQYRARNAAARAAGEEYLLMDDLSY